MALLSFFLALLLTTVLGQPSVVNVCVPYPVKGTFLDRCTNSIGLANTDDLNFVCVEGGSADDCIDQLSKEESQVTTLDGSDVIRAHSDHGLQPIIAENTGNDIPSGTYYAVAVVNKDFCKEDTTLSDLKGKRSCHTGFRKSAGWKIPVGTLLTEVEAFQTRGVDGIVEDDAEAVAAFFDTTCAPRVSGNGPINTEDGEGSLWADLCDGCKGDCTTDDQYYDYPGAFRCLMEGNGDVAFVKHSTVLDYAADGRLDEVFHAWADKNASAFKLLCRNGGCADVDEYKDCFLAVAPGHAMVTTEAFGHGGDDEDTGTAIRSAILMAAEDDAFLNETVGLTTNFLWSGDTIGLQPIEKGMDNYISNASLDTYLAFETLAEENTNAIAPTAIHCSTSEEEFDFCNKMIKTVVKLAPDFVWDCVRENSTAECIQAIEDGNADWMTVSPRQAHSAFLQHGLTVVVSEQGSLGNGTDYYSVAVVKEKFCKENKDARLLDLKGKNSCHTGFRRNAGWDIPVGRMISLGIMDPVRDDDAVENDAETVAAFFGSTCAPNRNGEGPRTTTGGLKRSWSPLCSACKDSCDQESTYVGYEGAHRCLKDDAGDVAFVKHTTPFDFDKKKERADLRLLCPTIGGCADLESYEDCNLGRVPARAVIVRNWPTYTIKFKAALMNISGEEAFTESVLNEEGNPEGYVFRPSDGLIPLDGDIEAYLGDAYGTYTALNTLEAPDNDTVVVCIPYESDEVDIDRCNALFESTNFTGVRFKCIEGGSPSICMEQMHKGEAHLTTLDGGDVFRAHHVYGIVPLVREVGKDAKEGTYTAVAVVDADFCDDDTTLADLEGKRSCHTGYRKMAGWRVPVGTLYSEVKSFGGKGKRKKGSIEDDAELVAAFFDTTCAPRVSGNGPVNTEDGEGSLWDDLCDGCKGDCTTDDQYYDYPGAFRCLMEGNGDVAFVKHSTVLDYAADGRLDEVFHAWADKNASAFKLLCRNGGCADVDEYKDCNLAVVPSHAIVGAAALGQRGALAALGRVIQNELIVASKDPKFFKEAKGLINAFPFSASTVSLVKVKGGYEGYITPDADKTLNAFAELIEGEKRGNPGQFATFCATSPKQFEACQENIKVYAKVQPKLEWSCHEENSIQACFDAVKSGRAQFMTAGPYDALKAHQSHGLSAVAAESVDGITAVYSVAVVDVDSCKKTSYITDYEGKDICFPNYGGDVGWKTPMSVMINHGLLSKSDTATVKSNVAQSVIDYFGSVCAPHDVDDASALDDLCGACDGDCTPDGKFSGPIGSTKCLEANGASLGFTDNTLLLGKADIKNLRLICPYKRGCHDLDGYRTCNWGETPSDMILLKGDADPAYVSSLQSSLVAASTEDDHKSLLVRTRADGKLVSLIGDTGLYLAPYASNKRVIDTFEEA